MRSCYPDFVVSRRKSIALVDDETSGAVPDDVPEVGGFDDVKLFLADHEINFPADESEFFPEQEVAEVLAWKEKRAQIARLQKARRFDQAKEMRRSFRVEIEELKKKTKCNRCHKVGHWARECRQKREGMSSSQSSTSASHSKSMPKESGAGYVAQEPLSTDSQPMFVASVGCQQTLLQQLRQRNEEAEEGSASSIHSEVLLVSSPGFAVLDSGCGKTIVGDRTLKQFQQLWADGGRYSPKFKSETNVFRFGNGERETTTTTVIMPVGLAGRFGSVQAAVVRGDAPQLLSRPALKRLGATIDLHGDRLKPFHGAVDMSLKSNAAGQYVVDVMEFPKNDIDSEANVVVDQAETEVGVLDWVQVVGSPDSPPYNPHNPHSPPDAISNEQDVVPKSGAPSPEGVSCQSCLCRPKPCHAVQGISPSKKQGGISKKQLRSLKKQIQGGQVTKGW